MIFQMFPELCHNTTQFQILWYSRPERNAVLINCLCYIQIRVMKVDLVQNPPVGPECSARIILSFKFDKKTFSNHFWRWPAGFTSYHILLFCLFLRTSTFCAYAIY